MAAYKQALALNLQDSLAHYGLGQVYLAQDKVAEAEAAYIQAVNAYPTYMPARLALARLYVIKGHFKAAVDQYQTINKLQPDYKASFESLGDLYLAYGQKDEAFEQYRQAIEAPAETGEYYFKLANLCRAKGLIAWLSSLVRREQGPLILAWLPFTRLKVN
jgi:tetratricopeptide (TPR) repeat protein